MKDEQPECICTEICHLGEGPIWNICQQKLYWTDIFEKRIWVYDPLVKKHKVFWEGGLQVGGFAFTKNGGMVFCTDRGVFILRPGEMNKPDHKPALLYSIPLAPKEMFNDITIDPEGRIYAGTLDRSPAKGVLYRLEKNREPVVVLRDIGCSNGMTFSLDCRYFLHTDTAAGTITRYCYDRSNGEISDPKVIFRNGMLPGVPDGITLDTEGCVWAAFWGGSAVRRISAEGVVLEEIKLPAMQPSSVMFGGPDLRDLYITSACQGAKDIRDGYDDKGGFLGGPVYRYRAAVGGRPEWLADFD